MTWIARWLPSAWGVAPTPMKAPGFTSARLALTTPYTAALSVSFTFTSPASPALTVSVAPSTASTGPRIRTVCCAAAGKTASMPTRAAAASARCPILLIFPPLEAACRHDNGTRKTAEAAFRRSHRRRETIAADRNRGRLERAVVLLVRAGNEDLGAGLELALVAGNVGHDHRLRRHDDFLFPLFILERDLVALHALDHLRHSGVGHGAVRHQVPRPMPLAGAAHRLRKDMDLHRLLAAVGLRHASDADERVVLDVGERRLDDAAHRGVVGQLDLVGGLAVA